MERRKKERKRKFCTLEREGGQKLRVAKQSPRLSAKTDAFLTPLHAAGVHRKRGRDC